MLILTRKHDESIQIGDGIEVKIVSIEGDQVKLGIDAPKHVDIHRKEIYDSIQEENKVAVISSAKIPSSLSLNE
ncbi:carbon storage regulator CsrA [Salicibibacter cibi]|uniref:Translational regulator CsrA n=1 Tax=Salicibibacter cibi TaxID=2743001 RepID=A0A7T6ZDU3_9BACI|nr:carbon storage regulator CsrA [Salicibibacter cibi]QQK81576.1 carbon storage regulator CsrA [Salicibibacter cibi]